MRKIIFYLILALLFQGIAFSKQNKMITIDFTDVYSNEIVDLYVDARKELAENITTDWTTGVAKSLLIEITDRKESFVVEIPRLKLKKEFQIEPNDGLYVSIALHDKNIIINQTKNPILRD